MNTHYILSDLVKVNRTCNGRLEGIIHYSEFEVLHAIEEQPKYPSFMFYGPSGCGKSTICSLVNGIDLGDYGPSTYERLDHFIRRYRIGGARFVTAEDIPVRLLRDLNCKVVLVVFMWESESIRQRNRVIRNSAMPEKKNQPSDTETCEQFWENALLSGLPATKLICSDDVAVTLARLKTIVSNFEFFLR